MILTDVFFTIIWFLLSVSIATVAAYRIWRNRLPAGWLRRISTLLTTLTLTAICFVGGGGIVGTIVYHYPTRTFNTIQWVKYADTRYQMVSSLLDSVSLYGFDKTQVTALLGLPDAGYETSVWVYEVGTEPGASNPGVLSVHFDSNKVEKTELTQP